MDLRKYNRTTLTNGIQIIHYYQSNGTIHVRFRFETGAANENDSNRGVSHLIEHCMFTSTNKDFYKETSSCGAITNATTGLYFTEYRFSSISKYFVPMLKLFVETLYNFKASKEDMEREKEIIYNEIDTCHSNSWNNLYELSSQHLFPNHYCSHMVGGEKEEVEKLTIDDMNDYYDNNYGTNNLKVIVVGDIDEGQVNSLLAILKSIEVKVVHNKLSFDTIEYDKKADIVFHTDDVKQIYMESLLYLNDYSKNYGNISIAQSILGRGFDSYLYSEIREKRGLGYDVGVIDFSIDPKNTFWKFYATTSKEENVDTIKEIFESSIDYLQNVEKDEFERTKLFEVTQFLLGNQRNFDIAIYESSAIFFGKKDYMTMYMELANTEYDEFKKFVSTLPHDFAHTMVCK